MTERQKAFNECADYCKHLAALIDTASSHDATGQILNLSLMEVVRWAKDKAKEAENDATFSDLP